MSTITKSSPFSTSNSNDNILVSNKNSYEDLIGYCALRKQISRIIPSYYTEIQEQNTKNRKQNNISSLEEYKKLKQEINNLNASIEILKESKQEKLKTIENLRNIMRKVGQKQISYKDKKQGNDNIINNYCAREKQNIDERSRCCERKGSSNFKVSSDEGLSIAPTTSGLSSGKDEDYFAEEGGNQPVCYCDLSISKSSSGSWCFTNEENNNELLMLRNPEQGTAPLQNSN